MAVEVGLEVLLARRLHLVQGRRIGLITNHTGLTRDLAAGVDELLRAGVRVTALFGPEHGVRGAAPAGEKVGDAVDPATGIPVFSLYGETRKPTPAMLEQVDLLVLDLQDIGARYYTLPYTMAYCMEAARENGRPFLVLDRPNPIGGEAVEGPVLDPAFRSFVGLYPIPVRHGLTMGEMAQLFNAEFGIGCDLTVVPCAGLTRRTWWADTGWPWVPPSPNSTGPDMAVLYPGTCLMEGTNLSEGRGTAKPFEWLGSPTCDGPAAAADLNGRGLPGVRFRPVWFTPLASKHQGALCSGIQVHVIDPRAVRPVELGLHLLDALRRHDPQFAWLPPYREGGRRFIDLLLGGDRIPAALEAGRPPAELAAEWREGEEAFRRQREPYLLYR